jgi:hypothetical protein
LIIQNEDTGPRRVMPGSHVHGVLTVQDVLHYASAPQEVPCLARRGGVIAMRPLLIVIPSISEKGH